MENNLIHVFERVAKERGNAVAITDGLTSYSYTALDAQANRIAGVLSVAAHTNNTPVGIYLGQTATAVSAMLGVLKNGGYYVPLDTRLSAHYLQTLVEEAGIRVVLTSGIWIERWKELFTGSGVTVLNIDTPPHETTDNAAGGGTTSHSPAYILFTSGTTGTPKGVVQTHENVLHFCREFAATFHIHREEVMLLTTSLSHTVAALDVFSTLLSGGKVAMYDVKQNRSVPDLQAFIREQGVTVFHAIPSFFRLIFSSFERVPEILRLVILGGEDVHAKDVECFKKKCPEKAVLANLYGSTELIMATAFLLNKQTQLSRPKLPIGYPVKGVKYTLENEQGRVPGMMYPGELVFESAYISPGYWTRASWQMAVSGAVTTYRSGDYARLMHDGVLEYAGRRDAQVKINGNRVELQEIEVQLDNYDGIGKSVIKSFTRENGELFIAAFYTVLRPLNKEKLAYYLGGRLPAYMVPAQFVELDAFPLNNNGKIDRKALTTDMLQQYGMNGVMLNETQERLVNIWKQVLEHNNFGLEDPFFTVGGNSLKVSQLHLEINEAYPDLISMQDLFDNDSINRVAGLLLTRISGPREAKTLTRDIEF